MIAAILIFCVVILFFTYLNGKYNEMYWRRRNVTFYHKNKVTGVFWDFMTKDLAFFEGFRQIYKEYPNEPAVGVGSFLTPALYVIDPVNIHHVVTADFNSFNHRGIETNVNDLLADNILFMNGNRWRIVRQHMTPLFTSTRLKSMYYIIDKSARDFITQLNSNPKLLTQNVQDTLSTFCSAAICAAVFGVTTKSIFDSPFLDMSKEALSSNFITNLKFTLGNISPPVFKALKISFFKDHEKFFIGAIKEILRKREQENAKKYDFADLCVQLQSSGNMVDRSTGLELAPTDELLAAQAFFFFVAGVDPAASAMFCALVELGRNPKYLKRLHKEIDATFEKHNSELSYDAINDMEFLEMALSESLRMHPPIGFLTRQCVNDTVLPTGNIRVAKGTKIFTPIFELHHDERYYPDPEVYNPERFSPENRHKIASVAFLPFGKGNRVCVGKRYATLQVKAGLVHLLRNFTVKTIVKDGGIRYSKQQVQVRLDNVDVELIPRDIKN